MWHGPCQASDLGKNIFVLNLVFFQPESAPNPLSFASKTESIKYSFLKYKYAGKMDLKGNNF